MTDQQLGKAIMQLIDESGRKLSIAVADIRDDGVFGKTYENADLPDGWQWRVTPDAETATA